MNIKNIMAVLLLISVCTASASAQNNHSLRDENRRIHHGVRSGQLTGRESARLYAQKSQLRREAMHYRANDGHIGRRERADLRRDNRRLSRNIYHQKHDRQRRF